MTAQVAYSEGSLDTSLLANNIILSDRLDNGGYKDAVAVIEQKLANNWQYVFAADEGDAEFMVGVKSHERLVRLSTPMSSPDHKEYRSIAKLNLRTGTIAFVDNELYEDGTIKWERGLKAKFIALDNYNLEYFTESGQ